MATVAQSRPWTIIPPGTSGSQASAFRVPGPAGTSRSCRTGIAMRSDKAARNYHAALCLAATGRNVVARRIACPITVRAGVAIS
jgi:hypothetical protein